MIHIEQLKEDIYLIRGGKEFKAFGDKYSFSLVFILDGSVAHIKSLCKNGTESLDSVEYMEVNDGLKFMGITHMKFDRYKNGKIRYVTKEII